MTRAAVLLRGVNVGGHNRIAMPAFRTALEEIGCTDVQTYLQSGNAVVTTRQEPAALATAVETKLRQDLDLSVPVLVRTAQELEAVVSANPFADEELDPKLLHVAFLASPPPGLEVDALLPDRVVAGDRALYVAYAVNSRDSKVAKLLAGKQLPVSSARNWRTVLALRDLCRQ